MTVTSGDNSRDRPIVKFASPALLQPAGDVDVVTREERRNVDQQPPVRLLGGDVAHPDRRGREAVAHALLHFGWGAGGAEAGILDLGDDLPADVTEDEQPRPARLGVVEADRRRAEPGLERRQIDEAAGNPLRVRCRQRQEDAPALAVDMDRKQPILRFGIAKRLLRVARRGDRR